MASNVKNSNLIVGLDIGTSKVVCIVGKYNETNDLEIVALGSYPSSGLKRGIVVNIDATTDAIKKAVDQAQSMIEEKKAEIAEDKFKVALKQEIGEGLIDIERDEDKVIITVGSGGAFKSGSADLTNKAKNIMAKIADVNKDGKSEILVSGHTDNKPLTFGSVYRDNWDLAAARSSSVVQELTGSGKLNPKRMKAISYGETQPVESNATSKGREKNRRIEIEINY